MTGTQGRVITEHFCGRAGNRPQTIWEVEKGWTSLPTPLVFASIDPQVTETYRPLHCGQLSVCIS